MGPPKPGFAPRRAPISILPSFGKLLIDFDHCSPGKLWTKLLAISIEAFLQFEGPLKSFSITLYKIFIKVYAGLEKKCFYKFFSSSDFSTIISYLHGCFVKVHCKAYPEKSFLCGYLIAHQGKKWKQKSCCTLISWQIVSLTKFHSRILSASLVIDTRSLFFFLQCWRACSIDILTSTMLYSFPFHFNHPFKVWL